MKNNTQQSTVSPKMTMYKNAMKNKHNQSTQLGEQLQKNQSLTQFQEQQQNQRNKDQEKLKDILEQNRKEIKINQIQSNIQHLDQQQKSFTTQKQSFSEAFKELQIDNKKLYLPIQECKQRFKENVNFDFETPRFFGMP
ncbi:unnamed protein product [Paramecium primaurelia]|uniref:Uncharacterized protein n=1 Tax=Paramecium primaurelia TaxID=5886 RepID=A0A8S1JXI1_PARPR|nr:unnamed protein product [Paramecium primaurelia]